MDLVVVFVPRMVYIMGADLIDVADVGVVVMEGGGCVGAGQGVSRNGNEVSRGGDGVNHGDRNNSQRSLNLKFEILF